MTYSFQVRFAEDGTGTVSGVAGDVPTTGYISVNGFNDATYTNIGASLFDADGAQLVGGYGTAPTPSAPVPPADAAPLAADPPGELAATVDDGQADEDGPYTAPDPGTPATADMLAGGE